MVFLAGSAGPGRASLRERILPGLPEAQRLGKSEGSPLPLLQFKMKWDPGLRPRRVDPSLSLSDEARFVPTIRF